MQIDVGASISRLLYENDKVIIPGFGGLVAAYQNAAIDQVQGVFSPPAKDLSFNTNLITNDGLLINHIKTKYNVSFAEAEQAVADFVAQAKTTFERRENVVLPEIGKLFKDYEGKVQFVSDSNNFNSQSYGLPPVQFYPVLRDRIPDPAIATGTVATPNNAPIGAASTSTANIATPTPAVAADESIPTEVDKEISYYLQKAIPFLAGLAILVVALSLYLVMSKDNNTRVNDGSELAESVEEAQIRINQKPELEDDAAYTEEGTIIEEGSVVEEVPDTPPLVDTEGETLAPNQKECVIIIGGFRDKGNVERLIQKLYEAGYDAYTDKKGSITRVGAMFAYNRESEVDRKLRDVQKRFAEKAWILPPDERRD
ncbi:MAG: hypothetical protein AB8G22_24945 [Saprospiraceae bacterium]